MKNIILVSVLVIVLVAMMSPVLIFAQMQAPNANFEEWTALANGAENPTGWGSSNFAVSLGVPQSIFRTTDAAFGDFALKVISPSLGTTIYTTQAELNEGAFDDGGLPYTDRPLNMAAWIKGTIFPGDTAFVRAWLTRWDADLQMTEFIGDAYIDLATIDTIYNLRLAPFDYVSNAQPDTLYLVVGFGDHTEVTLNAGNQFFVDNIVFSGLSTGIIESNPLEEISIFPNPTNGKIQLDINFKNTTDVLLTIFNNKGQIMDEFKEEQVLNFEKRIDLSAYPGGVYFLKLMAAGKSVIKKVVLTDKW